MYENYSSFKSQNSTDFFNDKIKREINKGHRFASIATRAISNDFGVPKPMNEMHDLEIYRSSQSSGGQTSFYVTSSDNRHSDAASLCGCIAGEKKMKKKKDRGWLPAAGDPTYSRTRRRLDTRLRRSNRVSVTLMSHDVDGTTLLFAQLSNRRSFRGNDRWQSGLRASRFRSFSSSDVIPQARREIVLFSSPVYLRDWSGKLNLRFVTLSRDLMRVSNTKNKFYKWMEKVTFLLL